VRPEMRLWRRLRAHQPKGDLYFSAEPGQHRAECRDLAEIASRPRKGAPLNQQARACCPSEFGSTRHPGKRFPRLNLVGSALRLMIDGEMQADNGGARDPGGDYPQHAQGAPTCDFPNLEAGNIAYSCCTHGGAGDWTAWRPPVETLHVLRAARSQRHRAVGPWRGGRAGIGKPTALSTRRAASVGRPPAIKEKIEDGLVLKIG